MRASIRPDTSAWKGMVSTCLLVATWLCVNIPSLQWLFHSFKQASHFNLILISLAIAVLLVQAVRHHRVEIYTTLTLRPYPLLLMLGSAVSAIALQWLVDIEQITVILFVLGTYGLCGLFIQPAIWHKGLPAASLVACILPFCSQFGTGLGFPVRVLTARAVEQILSNWHIAAVSSYDIIVLENGIAHVDLPCSGMRSLWTGTLFLLGATWLEGRQIGTRWLLVWTSSLLLQVLANMVRVLILVVITHVLKQPIYAQIVHVPLGLLGFICACALTWVMLQGVTKAKEPDAVKPNEQLNNPKFTQLLFLIVIFIALIPQVRHPQEEPLSIASLTWPSLMVSERVPFTEAEQSFFDSASAAVSQKRRFVLDKRKDSGRGLDRKPFSSTLAI